MTMELSKPLINKKTVQKNYSLKKHEGKIGGRTAREAEIPLKIILGKLFAYLLLN